MFLLAKVSDHGHVKVAQSGRPASVQKKPALQMMLGGGVVTVIVSSQECDTSKYCTGEGMNFVYIRLCTYIRLCDQGPCHKWQTM